jgi:superfamily II DNA or RNA helicase
MQWVKMILHHLDKERTITFCKTIAQTEHLGRNCIHSQNKDAALIYDKFNMKEIDHITAVNILNENANLVDCKYAIFANLSSSDICMPQRLGRSLRHKSPVIIMPYYKGTREEEILQKYLEGFNKDYIKVIHSVNEI